MDVSDDGVKKIAHAVAGTVLVGTLVSGLYFAAGPLAPFLLAHPAVRKQVEQATSNGLPLLLGHIFKWL